MSTIKALRTRYGLSESDLARRLGTEAHVIERWESGISSPNEGQVASLARLFHVSKSAITDASTLLLPSELQPIAPGAGGVEHQPG